MILPMTVMPPTFSAFVLGLAIEAETSLPRRGLSTDCASGRIGT
jgi:hypothetical protein